MSRPMSGPDVVHRHDVVRPRDGHDRRAVLPADRERVVTTGSLLGEQGRRGGVERVPVEVDVLEADLLGERTRLGHLRLGGRDMSSRRSACSVRWCSSPNTIGRAA